MGFNRVILGFGLITLFFSLASIDLAPSPFKSRAINRKSSDELARKLTRMTSRPRSEHARLASIVHKVKPGDTLAKIWSRFGAPFGLALQAEKALDSVGGSAPKLQSGEKIELRFAPNGRIIGLTKNLGAGKMVVLDGSRTSGYSASLHSPTIVERERVVSGLITSSLVDAALKENVPYSVIDDFVDLFGSKIEFSRDLQPGDTFSLVYVERVSEDGEHFEAGPIRAASINNSGALMAAVQYVGSDNKERFYDQDGQLLGNYFLRYPLNFTRISSVFTTSRFHPVLKTNRPHNGIDFAAPLGTAVRAVADGTIEIAGYNGGSGNMIKVRHDQRYSTAYLHLSRIAAGVKNGTKIARGQIIGAVGMTGLATGPHLHYSLYDHGRYVDPLKTALPILNPSGQHIPAALLAARLEVLRVEHEKTLLAYNSQSKKAA